MKKLLIILFLWAASIQLVSAVGYNYNQQMNGVDVCWQYDDMCGVLTASNTEIIHWVTDGGSNSCEISGYGWALTPNSQYYAYYPYSQSYKINKNPMTALPVSYKGQTQTENGSAAHLNAYDFMTAQALSEEENCHFDFNHLGCVLRIECEVRGKQKLKDLTISSSSKVFADEATMDAVNGTLTPTAYSSTMSLSLDNVTIEAGEHLVAFIMLPAMDLTDKLMTVLLTNAEGKVCSADIRATDIKQGCLYPIYLKMSAFRNARARAFDFDLNSDSDSDSDSDFNFNFDSDFNVRKAAAKAPIISRVTAAMPNFLSDDAHCFEQINWIDDSGIDSPNISTSGGTESGRRSYTLNGMKTSFADRGTIIIRNGKKYLK